VVVDYLDSTNSKAIKMQRFKIKKLFNKKKTSKSVAKVGDNFEPFLDANITNSSTRDERSNAKNQVWQAEGFYCKKREGKRLQYIMLLSWKFDTCS